MKPFRFSLRTLSWVVFAAAIFFAYARGSHVGFVLFVWVAWAMVVWYFIQLVIMGRVPTSTGSLTRRERVAISIALVAATMAAFGVTLWLAPARF